MNNYIERLIQMKALVCELCGGNDFLKENDFFVCQNCGTKYTAEDAKKMMVEGTVDVQGTVRVDNSDFVQKFLMNARRAKQKEDWEETEKYYNMVEQNDPTNIEAIFYSCYGKAKVSLIDSDIFKREAAFNTLQKCISIIDDNFSMEKEEENKAIIQQISDDIIGMACSNYVFTQSKNGYGMVVSDNSDKTITLFNNVGREFMIALENIAKKIPESQRTKRIYYYELALKHANFILQNGRLANPQAFKNIVMQYHQILHDLDPNHYVPDRSAVDDPSDKATGGMIALSVLVPIVGVILGVVNLTQNKRCGKVYLGIGIASFTICILISIIQMAVR